MIDKYAIEKRIVVLDEDIAKVQQNIKNLEQQILEMKGNLVSAYNTMHHSLNVTKQFHLEQLKMYDSEMETES